MPSLRPVHNKGRNKHPRGRPWAARRKRNEVEYFLGYFATKEEAEEAEAAFDEKWPGMRGKCYVDVGR